MAYARFNFEFTGSSTEREAAYYFAQRMDELDVYLVKVDQIVRDLEVRIAGGSKRHMDLWNVEEHREEVVRLRRELVRFYRGGMIGDDDKNVSLPRRISDWGRGFRMSVETFEFDEGLTRGFGESVLLSMGPWDGVKKLNV